MRARTHARTYARTHSLTLTHKCVGVGARARGRMCAGQAELGSLVMGREGSAAALVLLKVV